MRHKLGKKQELFIVTIYNWMNNMDNRYDAGSCTDAALRGEKLKTLVERIEDSHIYKLTDEGIAAAKELISTGAFAVRENGRTYKWKRTFRIADRPASWKDDNDTRIINL